MHFLIGVGFLPSHTHDSGSPGKILEFRAAIALTSVHTSKMPGPSPSSPDTDTSDTDMPSQYPSRRRSRLTVEELRTLQIRLSGLFESLGHTRSEHDNSGGETKDDS